MVENVSPLVSKILNSDEFSTMLDGIVTEGRRCGLGGDELLQTIAVSGAAAAVDLAQKYFTAGSSELVKLIRSCIKQVDAASMCVTEIEGLSALAKVRKHFSDLSELHAQVLCEAYLARTYAAIGVDRTHLVSTTDVSKYSSFELQAIGLTVYQKVPEYFNAWCDLDRLDAISGMACKCVSCLLIKQATNSTRETLSGRITLAAGLDSVFCDFGFFVLEEHRKQLSSIAGDTDTSHDYSNVDAERDVTELIAELRGRGKM